MKIFVVLIKSYLVDQLVGEKDQEKHDKLSQPALYPSILINSFQGGSKPSILYSAASQWKRSRQADKKFLLR